MNVPNPSTNFGGVAKSAEGVQGTYIRMNLGSGFKRYSAAPASGVGTKYALNSREDAGVAVADMNQDGLADVVLLGKVGLNTVMRTKIQVLVASTGTTEQAHLVPGLPLRAGGLEIDTGVPLNAGDASEGSVPATLGDFNGDGLVDILVVRGGVFHFYIHQGKKADQLTGVDTGTGRHLAIQYAPISDPAVYRRMRKSVTQIPGEGTTGPWEQPTECKWPLSCATSWLWVVKRYDVTNDQKVNAGHAMKYMEGRSARTNWLGFAETYDLEETNMMLQVTTYDNRTAGAGTTPGTMDHFPFAHKAAQEIKVVWDNGAPPTARPHRYTKTNHYLEVANTFLPTSFTARLTDSSQVEEQMNGVPTSALLEDLAFNQTYATDDMASATTYFFYDQYDNVTREQLINAASQVLDKNYTLFNDPVPWIMGRIGKIAETSTNQITGETATRSHDFLYQGVNAGTFLPSSEIVQNGGANDVKLTITYERGSNSLGQVTRKTTSATSTADDTSVAPGSQLARAETTTYDTNDAVTIASITNALGQKTSYAYHGGLGLLAQSEDPNKVVTSYQYDGFGRLRTRSAPTDGTLSVSYEGQATLPLPTFPTLIASSVAALGPAYAEHTKQVGGEETIVTYNMNGRELVRQTKGGDDAWRYVVTRYRPTPGRVASVSQPFRDVPAAVLRQTFYTYDNLGRVVDTLNPGGASRRKATYTPRFGPLGFVKTTTDELGHVRDEAVDDFGRTEAVTVHLAGTNTAATITSMDRSVCLRASPRRP
jgi:YD repeat-containing protein